MRIDKQTLGEFFQEARKEKGVSVDEVVRDTNIPRKYLESIESDNFDVFPGETYAQGFVANYADALEVDRELAVALYKKQMKIAQDAPLEQLVGRKKQFVINENVFIIGGIVAAALVIVIIVSMVAKQGGRDTTPRSKSQVFPWSDMGSVAQNRYRIGDTVTLTNELRTLSLAFLKVEQNRSLSLRINNSEYNVQSGALLSIDADMNGTNDLGIELLAAREKEIRIAIAELKELGGSSINSSDEIYSKYRELILSETEFMTSSQKTAVDLRALASGNAYLNFSADGTAEREQTIYNGSTVTISFQNYAIVQLGNSGAVKFQLNGKEEIGGGWGEVTKCIFYWKPKNNQFALVRAILK